MATTHPRFAQENKNAPDVLAHNDISHIDNGIIFS
jgi:hypothetical protein